jgi:crotonobetainyl-CoA:carnitine CoA-transferase CaiB-like acyl-CoA transferase
MHTAVAVQAALAHRRQTGEGQHIEIAQFELGACLTAESVIDYGMNGRIQQRSGNRGREPAPHGVYPCLDGGWIAIAASSPEQWESLIRQLGSPAWAGQPEFAEPGERTAHADALDQHLAKETCSHSAPALAEKLRSQGVAAAEVIVSAQMYDDPQLQSRSYFQPLDHPVSRTRRYPTWPMRFSFLPGEVHRFGAPTLGQHNEEVLGGELGLSEDELARLASEGIIGQRLPTSK